MGKIARKLWPMGLAAALSVGVLAAQQPAGRQEEAAAASNAVKGTISGRVLDEAGRPVPGVLVEIYSQRYDHGKRVLAQALAGNPGTMLQSGMTSVTNDLGEYRLFAVSPGEYLLTTKAPPRFNAPAAADFSTAERVPENLLPNFFLRSSQAFAPIYFPGTADPAQAVVIRVTAGVDASGADVRWRPVPAGTIRAVLQMEGGNQSASVTTQIASVTLVDAASGLTLTAGTYDAQERFEIRGVPPGAYVLYAIERSRIGRLEAYFSGSLPVALSAGEIKDVLVPMKAPVGVEGRIVAEAGPASQIDLSGLKVQLDPIPPLGVRFGPLSWSVTKAGAFTLQRVPDLEYRLRLTGLPKGSYVQSASFGFADPMTTAFTPAASPDAMLRIVIGATPGAVRGLAVDAKGQPSPGALVTLLPSEVNSGRTDRYFSTQAGAQGEFEFDAIPPGAYRAMAWSALPPGAEQSEDFLRPFASRGVSVQLGPQAATEIRLPLIVR